MARHTFGTRPPMNQRDPGHLEARTAIGAFALAAVVLVVALVAGASVARAALLAFVPLALGAGAMFAAWRRAAGRNVALEAALRKTHDDVTRGAARRAAAEAEVEHVRSDVDDVRAE